MNNEVAVRVTGNQAGTKPAKARHGRVGYCLGEQVTFYDGLGWVSPKELAVAAECGLAHGNVYLSQTSFLYAEKVEGSSGWRYSARNGTPELKREKVFWRNGEWQTYRSVNPLSCYD